MRRILLVPQSLLAGAPIGDCDAIGVNDTESLLVLRQGFAGCPRDYDDWFVAQPGVIELYPWDQDKPVPAELVDAMVRSPLPATRTAALEASTLRQAVRAIHPMVRWYD